MQRGYYVKGGSFAFRMFECGLDRDRSDTLLHGGLLVQRVRVIRGSTVAGSTLRMSVTSYPSLESCLSIHDPLSVVNPSQSFDF